MKEIGSQEQELPKRLNIADLSAEDLEALTSALKKKDQLRANEVIKRNLQKRPYSSTDKIEIS